MDEGNFRLINFYERRARRILPALFFVMGVCIPFAWMWMTPRDLKDFAQSLVAVSTFSSNIWFWRESGYFNTAAELKPLLHTWSLAVEEQYYILFPPFLMLAWRFGKRWILVLLVAAALISLGLAHWGAFNKPIATFFILPTRGWEILLGSLVAVYFNRQRLLEIHHSVSQILSACGIALVVYSVFAFDKQTPFPSLYALVPTAGAALVILFAQPTTFVYRLLGSRLLVGLGLISYSAYLWHQPLFAFARHKSLGIPSVGLMAILCLAAFPLAYISWRYVEKPFRQKNNISRKSVFAFGIVASTALIAVGLVGHVNAGFEKYYLDYRLTEIQKYNNNLIKSHTVYNMIDNMVDDGNCNFWSPSIDKETVERFMGCSEKFGEAVIVLGDSHAMNLYNILAKSNYHPFVVSISQGGCRPQNERSYCHYDSFDEFIKEYKNKISYVLFHQSGSYFIEDTYGGVDSALAFEDDQSYAFGVDNIDLVLRYLGGLNEYTPTLWIGPFAEARIKFDSKDLLNGNYYLNPNSIKIFSELEKSITDRIESQEFFDRRKFVPFSKIIEIKSDFLLTGNCVTYRNTDHFSRCGEEIISEHINPKLFELE